jgi:hypothetical protein
MNKLPHPYGREVKKIFAPSCHPSELVSGYDLSFRF